MNNKKFKIYLNKVLFKILPPIGIAAETIPLATSKILSFQLTLFFIDPELKSIGAVVISLSILGTEKSEGNSLVWVIYSWYCGVTVYSIFRK